MKNETALYGYGNIVFERAVPNMRAISSLELLWYNERSLRDKNKLNRSLGGDKVKSKESARAHFNHGFFRPQCRGTIAAPSVKQA